MQRQAVLTLADLVLPRRGLLARGAAVLGGTLLIALSAQIAIPFVPVPLTGQTFAVLLVAALLGGRLGAATMIAYLIEGAAGLPVFSGWSGGAARLFGPTGGYLIAFVPAAWIVGSLCERGWDRRFPTAALAMIAGNAVILLGGVAWLSLFTGVARAAAAGLVPFLAGDILKIVLAALALPAGWRLLGRTR
ncbi:MAG: biotin transporter BioY [Candidatus Eisenbacteria bacterium]|nr:biotin transporter BioY [Candidatus Eisenbacteria bacterium]